MRLEYISPFIVSARDVLNFFVHSYIKSSLIVLKDSLSVSGISITTFLSGGVEGRVVLDIEPLLAKKLANIINGTRFNRIDYLTIDTICEITNIIIGKAITLLNDRGFSVRLSTPFFYIGEKTYNDLESLCINLTTKWGDIRIQANIQERDNTIVDRRRSYA